MRTLFKLFKWFWSGALPWRQWRYFVRGQRRAEHARLRTFRLRFAPFALTQAVLGLPWAGVALVAPAGARAVLLGLGAIKVVGGGALVSTLVSRFFPVRANETEIRGRTFIGLSRRVRWEDIESVTQKQWLFTSYLLVGSKGERTLMWLPTFLCQQREFEADIQKWLAPEHPMRVYLAQHHAEPRSPKELPSCQTS